MTAAAALAALTARLRRSGLTEVEVYLKEGRSRRYEIGAQGRLAGQSEERGWAVRAGGRRRSFFACGSGRLDVDTAWPRPVGAPLLLPSPTEVAPWSRPSDFDVPLLGENEGIALLEGVERRLREELPDARLLRATLEEGSSEARLANSRGVEAVVHQRSASLSLEAARSGPHTARVTSLQAERAASGFSPSTLARRLADRLLLAEAGPAPPGDRGEVVLAPPVAARVVESLIGLFVGPEAAARARRLSDRSGRLASPGVHLVDDGRLAGGVMAAPVDGEGVETRELVIVDGGAYRQPLLTWRQARPGQRWSGCSARPSWRRPPRPGPTHLYLRPDPAVPAASLLTSVRRGFYLLESPRPGVFDLDEDRFELPVRGFVLRRGRSVGAFSEATLSGAITALLQGIEAVARDLTFAVGGTLVGAPTILVTGLEVRSPGES